MSYFAKTLILTSLIFIAVGVLGLNAWAEQDYSYLSNSTATPKGHLAILVAYSTYAADVSANGKKYAATGTGYSFGFELNTPSTTIPGQWILGLYYAQQAAEMTPNSTRETDVFRSVLTPLLWGLSLGPHILLGVGAMFKYGLDPIARDSDGTKTRLTHKEFGIRPIQVDEVGFARFMINYTRKSKFFIDFKYGIGAMDRALGVTDKWKDHEMFFGLGLMF